ncbi:MAG: hypothetical protein EXR51_04205 [Dehalococcoidia bacterium]|nr:hypothetical protein [Dehalococcoidia bacterium]
MMKRIREIRTEVHSVSQGLKQLRTSIAAYEERYWCFSEKTLQAVKAGTEQETAEIGKWSSHSIGQGRGRGLIFNPATELRLPKSG